MRPTQKRFNLAWGLLLGSSLLFVGWWRQQLHAHFTPQDNPQEIQQIIDRTDALCQSLLPKVSGLRYRVEPLMGYTPQSGSLPCWEVTCVDGEEKEHAHFVWERTRQELRSISRLNALPPDASPLANEATSRWNRPPLTPQEERQVMGLVWKWLDQVGVAAKSERWQLLHSPEATALPSVWGVQVGSQNLRAILTVDRATGELIALHVSPRHSQP